MDVRTINALLSRGELDHKEMWPHKLEVEAKGIRFRFEFGLDKLPEEPGLILIRGRANTAKALGWNST